MPEIGWWMIATSGSFALLFLLLFTGKQTRLDTRLQELTHQDKPAESFDNPVGQFAMQALPAMGKAIMPRSQQERTLLQTRLMHAGFYRPQALGIFLGVKLLLMVGPALVGATLGLLEIVPLQDGLIYGAFSGVVGMIGPSFWLDRMKAGRQVSFRRALPDALDVLVICLEGGLSLPAALRRVSGELRTAHPLLATELSIVQREIQLGQTPGDALLHFADRTDLEEIRSLALVINQSERFGASLVKALRIHAETLRTKRLHDAEEAASKAAVKILFPTLLCIFPGLFLVILGPAAIQMVATFANLRR